MKIFGERLKELRNEKEMSCMVLGKKLGIADSSIVRWENNQCDIKSEQLIKVAQFFGVTTDYLLGLEN